MIENGNGMALRMTLKLVEAIHKIKYNPQILREPSNNLFLEKDL